MMNLAVAIFYILSLSFVHAVSLTVDDVEDPDEILGRLRVERDYGTGGPLAKGPKDGAKPGPGPSPAKPSPSPASSAGQSPSQAPAPAPSPQVSSSVPGPGSQGQTAAKPAGAAAGSAGGACPMTVYPSRVLSDIASGKAQFPDYNHKFTETCKLSECDKICQKAACNYFMRSNNNGLAYFYTVKADLLKSPGLTDSASYDSFMIQSNCQNGLGNGPFVSQ